MLRDNANTRENNFQQHESSIGQLKTNYLRMKSNQTTPEEIQRQLYFTRKLNKLFIDEQSLPILTDRTCRLFYNTGEFRFIWIVLLNKDQEYEYFKSEGVFENFEGIEDLYRQKKIPALAQDAIQNQTIKIITSPQENCPITIDFNQCTEWQGQPLPTHLHGATIILSFSLSRLPTFRMPSQKSDNGTTTC